MSEHNLDMNPGIERMKPRFNQQLFLGAFYAVTLMYFYEQINLVIYQIAEHFVSSRYGALGLRYVLSLGFVILLGLLFQRQMKSIHSKRMVKVYITWLCSIFIFSIVYRFHLIVTLKRYLPKIQERVVLSYQDREFLIIYIEPLLFPLTLCIVFYMLFVYLKNQSIQSSI